MALINCKECGKELSDSAEFCPHCGFKYDHSDGQPVTNEAQQSQNITEQNIVNEQNQQIVQQQPQNNMSQQIQNNMTQQSQNGFNGTTQQFNPSSFLKNKPTTASIVIVVIALVFGIGIASSIFSSAQESKKAIRVDISMTEWYGYVDYILEELDLDFYLVTAGANCYTGVKKSEFSTEKYGVLHTEFTYCKSNNRQVFRVYNDEKDQPLRDPKPGELATFDRYGKKTSSSRNQL